MRKIWSLLLIFIAAVLAIGVVEAAPGLSDPGSLETHAEIYISGNGAFTAPNGVRDGSGTEGDPFIISNWTIDANGTDGIEIRMVTAYFIIQNCLINNSTAGTDGAIKINAKTGGHGWIWNCEIYDCEKGLYFYEGNNVTVNDTIVRDTNMFTYFFRVNCADIRISNCEGTNVTMVCYESVGVVNLRIDNCTFTNVTTNWGILLNAGGTTANWNVTIEDNTFTEFTIQAIYVNGGHYNILNNIFFNCTGPSRAPIILINAHNSTISRNHLTNTTGVYTDGIMIRGPDNQVTWNTLVNCTFVGIQASTNIPYRGDRTIISNNTIWTNFTYTPSYGLGGIYISDATDVIVEYNWVHNHTAVGIGTDRYTNSDRLIIRYNNIDGSQLRDIIMEHTTRNATIHNNIARNGFYAYIDESNDTLWYDNYAINHTIGLVVQGIRGVWKNNTVEDCEYGFIVTQGGHGYQTAQSTGNDTLVVNNTIINAEYGWAFVKYVLELYPRNSTIYNNTIDANTTDVIFGEFDGGEYVFTLKNIETFVWNTTNFVINATSNITLHIQNITGNEFLVAVIWNSTNLTIETPSSWERIRVQDITDGVFVEWTEGSVIFGADEGNEYLIFDTPVSTSPSSPNSVRDLPSLIMSIGVVIIAVVAIMHFVVRPVSKSIGGTRW